MEDLDEWILSLIDRRTRQGMIGALSREADAAAGIARGIRKRTGVEGDRRHDALSRVHRIGRILHFLYHEQDASDATDTDKALCTQIKERLAARGAW